MAAPSAVSGTARLVAAAGVLGGALVVRPRSFVTLLEIRS